MSSGCFSWLTSLFPWKYKFTKTKSEVSNEYQINKWCKLLDNYLRQDLLEKEPAIISRESTMVEDQVTETKSKAGLILILLSLSDILRPGTA